MRRIYFLVPDTEIGKKVVDELLLAHVEWKHIHVVARRGTPMADLPEASALQKSDLIPAMLRAVPMGGATGMLCGMVGLNVGSTRLKAFEAAIERGELLVIADVPRGEVEAITERIKRVDPEAEPEGTEARVPAFP